MFCYENELVYPIFISKQTFEDSIDLLLLIESDKSHYVYIKDFNPFMFHNYDNYGKISHGHLSIEDYLMCEKIWNKLEMKNMGDYHDHYF